MSRTCLVRPGLLLAALALPLDAQAQASVCSSDGLPRPVALLERFISADCEACWRDPATPAAGEREVALDWVLPGSKGDDAPLSTVARPEATARLAALRKPAPAHSDAVRTRLKAAARTLRVAHGLPFADYIGASIELTPAGRAPWTAWLALVETVPPGVEGSPVERNVVRNVLQPEWNGRAAPTRAEQKRLFESRPMNIPEGARADRLRLVGWVQDARGDVRAIAQTRCR